MYSKDLLISPDCLFVDQVKKNRSLERREFMKLISLSSLALYMLPLNAVSLGNTTAVNPVGIAFRQLVVWLVKNILPGVASGVIANKISQAPIIPSTQTNNFHNKYSSNYKLDVKVEPIKTKYNNSYFQINDGLPAYDSENPPRVIKDLNSRELKRVTNVKEIKYYGKVLYPCSERYIPNEKAANIYEDTSKNLYNRKPDSLHLEYVRAFNDGNKSYYGFGVHEPGNIEYKDLLLGPEITTE